MHRPSLNSLDLAVDEADIAEAFAPYVGRECDGDDSEFAGKAKALAGKWRRQHLRRRWLGWLPRVRHDQDNVKRVYARTWSVSGLAEKVAPGPGKTPAVWRGRNYLIDAQGTKRVHMLYLMRALARCAPASVLEVGCGNGLNLMVLANRFPEIAMHGIELTPEGVAVAESGIAMPDLPDGLVAFAPEDLPARDAHRRIAVRQGSAAALPFEDDAIDLAFTVLALEQMEEIRRQALDELARVARRHVVMIEPFRDWNEDGMRRQAIAARDYFQARVADLAGHGLKPVFVSGDLPCKLAMGVGVVVCEVV